LIIALLADVHANLVALNACVKHASARGPSQHAMAWWRSVASTVTANATCSVHVVRVPAQAGG
jgi:hypothetical protein